MGNPILVTTVCKFMITSKSLIKETHWGNKSIIVFSHFVYIQRDPQNAYCGVEPQERCSVDLCWMNKCEKIWVPLFYIIEQVAGNKGCD